MISAHQGNSDRLVVKRAETVGTGLPDPAGISIGVVVVSKGLLVASANSIIRQVVRTAPACMFEMRPLQFAPL
jgi:hypothetical protein